MIKSGGLAQAFCKPEKESKMPRKDLDLDCLLEILKDEGNYLSLLSSIRNQHAHAGGRLYGLYPKHFYSYFRGI